MFLLRRPDNDRRRYVGAGGVVKVVTFLGAIAIATILCIRFGKSMVGMLTKSYNEPKTFHGHRLNNSNTFTTVLNSTNDSGSDAAPDGGSNIAGVEIQPPGNHLANVRLRVNSRIVNDNYDMQDDATHPNDRYHNRSIVILLFEHLHLMSFFFHFHLKLLTNIF